MKVMLLFEQKKYENLTDCCEQTRETGFFFVEDKFLQVSYFFHLKVCFSFFFGKRAATTEAVGRVVWRRIRLIDG
jgi:hypothetical protein